ncbi:hypothetical protein TWF694_011256 [Orbilia ellipsospora]|uniref:Uncharacterized protein n=1 Tax=Orbilia ellipsospora TaxID=2528407 RepID=A0AAV9X9R1_9PEZI
MEWRRIIRPTLNVVATNLVPLIANSVGPSPDASIFVDGCKNWHIFGSQKPVSTYPLDTVVESSIHLSSEPAKPAPQLNLDCASAMSCISAIGDYEERMLGLNHKISPGVYLTAQEFDDIKINMLNLKQDVRLILQREISETDYWNEFFGQLDRAMKTIDSIVSSENSQKKFIHHHASTNQARSYTVLAITTMKIRQFKDRLRGLKFHDENDQTEIGELFLNSPSSVADTHLTRTSGSSTQITLSTPATSHHTTSSSSSAASILISYEPTIRPPSVSSAAEVCVTVESTLVMRRSIVEAMLSPIGLTHSSSIDIPSEENDARLGSIVPAARALEKIKKDEIDDAKEEIAEEIHRLELIMIGRVPNRPKRPTQEYFIQDQANRAAARAELEVIMKKEEEKQKEEEDNRKLERAERAERRAAASKRRRDAFLPGSRLHDLRVTLPTLTLEEQSQEHYDFMMGFLTELDFSDELRDTSDDKENKDDNENNNDTNKTEEDTKSAATEAPNRAITAQECKETRVTKFGLGSIPEEPEPTDNDYHSSTLSTISSLQGVQGSERSFSQSLSTPRMNSPILSEPDPMDIDSPSYYKAPQNTQISSPSPFEKNIEFVEDWNEEFRRRGHIYFTRKPKIWQRIFTWYNAQYKRSRHRPHSVVGVRGNEVVPDFTRETPPEWKFRYDNGNVSNIFSL